MKKYTINELTDLLFTIPIDIDNYFLSPLANKDVGHTEFTSLNGVKEIIMILLTRYERLSMTQLADYIGSSNQRMTFPVNKLIEDGLAQRTKDLSDKRIYYIEATEKGKAITEDYLQATYDVLSESFVGKFTAEDFDRFKKSLEINLKYMQLIANNINPEYE